MYFFILDFNKKYTIVIPFKWKIIFEVWKCLIASVWPDFSSTFRQKISRIFFSGRVKSCSFTCVVQNSYQVYNITIFCNTNNIPYTQQKKKLFFSNIVKELKLNCEHFSFFLFVCCMLLLPNWYFAWRKLSSHSQNIVLRRKTVQVFRLLSIFFFVLLKCLRGSHIFFPIYRNAYYVPFFLPSSSIWQMEE